VSDHKFYFFEICDQEMITLFIFLKCVIIGWDYLALGKSVSYAGQN